MTRFRKSTTIQAPACQVFAWHAREGALERLAPPWERLRVISRSDGLEPGSRVVIELRVGPVWRRWVAEHTELVPGESFRDRQVSGPFARWEHGHRVAAGGPAACVLTDDIAYELPAGRAGALAGRLAETKIASLFAYRHRITRDDLEQRRRYEGVSTMKIAVTGASGLIGSALTPFLTTGGHEVVRVARGGLVAQGTIAWDPEAGTIDAAALEGVDAVIHLAGESIAEGRWSDGKKQRILESRRRGTRLLAEALAGLTQKPKVLVAASAIGYYGSRGDEVLTEESTPGDDFLAGVVKEWEAATEPARAAGIRVVNLRNGLVLSGAGGALKKLLLPFKLGAGGRVGSGNQYWSWIAIDDVLGAIQHAMLTESLEGPVNLVAPVAVTNREFTKALGRVLHRPTILPTPAFGLRLMLGEVTDALLLASQRVEPRKLAASRYVFRHADLEDALRHVLGKA